MKRKFKQELKTISNRQVRRYKKGLKDGNNYRKVFDLWWNLD